MVGKAENVEEVAEAPKARSAPAVKVPIASSRSSGGPSTRVRTLQVMLTDLGLYNGRIDGFYYCPHHPTAEIERYRKDCDCRKPGPGMLRAAAADLGLDLSRSFAVGDKWTDVAVATAVGAKGILVRTGYGRSSEADRPAGVDPAFVADNIAAAAAWILRQS